MDGNVQVSPRLIEELNQWFKEQPPAQIRINLRKMLFDYLRTEISTGIPDYYEDLLIQLDGLFNLLERAEAESGSFSPRHADRSARISGLSLGHLMNYLADFTQPELIFVRQDPASPRDRAHHLLTVIVDEGDLMASHPSGTSLFSTLRTETAWYTVQFHSAEEMETRIRQGDPYFRLSCRQEFLLFNPKGRAIPVPSAELWEKRRNIGAARWQQHSQKARSYFCEASGCLHRGGMEAASVFLYLGLDQTLHSLVGGLDAAAPPKSAGLDRWLHFRHLGPALFTQNTDLPSPYQDLLGVLESLSPLGGGEDLPDAERLALLLPWADDLWTRCRLTVSQYLELESMDIPIFDPMNRGENRML